MKKWLKVTSECRKSGGTPLFRVFTGFACRIRSRAAKPATYETLRVFLRSDAHPPGDLLLPLRGNSPCVDRAGWNIRGCGPLSTPGFFDNLKWEGHFFRCSRGGFAGHFPSIPSRSCADKGGCLRKALCFPSVQEGSLLRCSSGSGSPPLASNPFSIPSGRMTRSGFPTPSSTQAIPAASLSQSSCPERA